MDNFFLKLSIMLVPGLMAITFHEVSHGFIAYLRGDNTARQLGRLTLNPLKHLDIIGTIMIIVVGIGWAKPVPVNFNNLRSPKRDMIWVAAAGPITNLIIATLSALLIRFIVPLTVPLSDSSPLQLFLEPVLLMLAFSVYINLILALFNLMPLPPLDGGRVLMGLLPDRMSASLARIEPYGMLIIIGVVFFTDIFKYTISPMLGVMVHFLAGPQSRLVFSVTQYLMR
ncbi:MAG: site-2 protease family protein [Geobacteraceae bacterium]|nr:site-2 protease family protein [Geobacteraceae bacterium]